MKRLPPMITYSLARLVLFGVPFVLLLLVGVDLFWSLLIAFVLSAVVSIFLLSRLRDQVSTGLVERRERIAERMAARSKAEDAWDEAQRSEHAERDGGGDSSTS